jgi:rhamnose transport system substrate-binding protein
MREVLPEAAVKQFRVPVVPPGVWILLAALLAELALFAAIAPNFLSASNFFEILRFSVELGLLAIALTPVIITGGIDLSVGSMMGLAAVVFGAVWRDWNLPLPAAACVALLFGIAGGGLNAFLISGLQLPALIVTLGSFWMFRGIAEGITHAAVNYTDFPKWFLFVGQGYFANLVPAQAPVFFLVFAAYVVLLHRSTIGRSWYAIGSNRAGACYAGIPVARRVGLAYLLSGMTSCIAAIIYVAHVGQARSDAGTGYELDAITAVVLGGTSIFGGRGNLWGTLLGLFALSILQNGLHLAALPSELTGVLTGILLVSVISLEKWLPRHRIRRLDQPEEVDVKNSQVAVLCAAVLVSALVVAGTNVWLVRSLGRSPEAKTASPIATAHRPVIAVMPKAKGDPYFVSARAGR